MRVHIQRVTRASVEIENGPTNSINNGLLMFLGVKRDEDTSSMKKLVEKCLNLRIFDDPDGKMNLSVKDIKGEILIISNFTLYGDCKKGNRPSYMNSAPGPEAEKIYNNFVDLLKQSEIPVKTGEFGAMMKVSLVNDGPITLLIES